MELKIRIKEVKEEMRELTIEERCLYNTSKNGIADGYIPDLISKVNDRLTEIGFVEAMYDKQLPAEILREVIGKFRTETIRDATPEEIIAWHCIGIAKMCGVMEWCMDCPKSKEDFLCYRLGEARVAEEFLKNKEVILELVD